MRFMAYIIAASEAGRYNRQNFPRIHCGTVITIMRMHGECVFSVRFVLYMAVINAHRRRRRQLAAFALGIQVRCLGLRQVRRSSVRFFLSYDITKLTAILLIIFPFNFILPTSLFQLYCLLIDCLLEFFPIRVKLFVLVECLF